MLKLMRILILLVAAGSLAACKSELYSNLSEREANEIVAALASASIPAAREGLKDGAYSVQVDNAAIADATRVLAARGLPRAKFETLGKVFQSGSMVSTPFEERARFMYALDQELSNSISGISGVASARVHVMLPETTPLDTRKERPRASVFIYLNPGADIRGQIGTIKTLIMNSVNNLAYEDVAVALFPATAEAASATAAVGDASGSGLLGLIAALGAILAAAYLGMRLKRAPVARRPV